MVLNCLKVDRFYQHTSIPHFISGSLTTEYLQASCRPKNMRQWSNPFQHWRVTSSPFWFRRRLHSCSRQGRRKDQADRSWHGLNRCWPRAEWRKQTKIDQTEKVPTSAALFETRRSCRNFEGTFRYRIFFFFLHRTLALTKLRARTKNFRLSRFSQSRVMVDTIRSTCWTYRNERQHQRSYLQQRPRKQRTCALETTF